MATRHLPPMLIDRTVAELIKECQTSPASPQQFSGRFHAIAKTAESPEDRALAITFLLEAGNEGVSETEPRWLAGLRQEARRILVRHLLNERLWHGDVRNSRPLKDAIRNCILFFGSHPEHARFHDRDLTCLHVFLGKCLDYDSWLCGVGIGRALGNARAWGILTEHPLLDAASPIYENLEANVSAIPHWNRLRNTPLESDFMTAGPEEWDGLIHRPSGEVEKRQRDLWRVIALCQRVFERTEPKSDDRRAATILLMLMIRVAENFPAGILTA